MSLADYSENKQIDNLTGKTQFTKPTCYVGLSTADPGEDASGLAEPSGNGYARVATAGADWNAASGGSTTNANAITFPTASGAWGTITHFALFDAATEGNMLASAALDDSEVITTNQIPRFPAGDLAVTLG